MDKKALGERIKRFRENIGMSQEELAGHLGISRSSISQLEQGNRELKSE